MPEDVNSHAQQARTAWTRLLEDQATRVEHATGEAARLEAQGIAQAKAAIDEIAKLQKDTLGYFEELAGQWRKLAVEAARQATDLLTKVG